MAYPFDFLDCGFLDDAFFEVFFAEIFVFDFVGFVLVVLAGEDLDFNLPPSPLPF